jgi:aldehyde:ferredoxin oxidoreductase
MEREESARPYGFHNRVLRVDLSNRQISVEQPGERFFRTYFGGWGLIAYYLLKEVKPKADPLGPDNVLVFANGIVTGTPAIGSGRNAVGAKSPLTGGFGESDAGGFWGAELKHAGWDAVVVTGQAEEPIYLWIKDDQVEIRDAAHLWGNKTAEVEAILRGELGDKRVRVTQCGVAGENLVRYACVLNDIHHAAGRTGLGAVMGSKKLKAIAVRGTGKVELADRDKVLQVANRLRDYYQEGAGALIREHGTGGNVVYINESGALPTRNFQEGFFEGARKITGKTMTETILVGRETCFACPRTCKRKVKVTGRYEVDPAYGGPEYETLAALGAGCGVDDLEAIAYANQLCEAYGLDTISTGVTIAWAMECFERGLLNEEHTGGLELRFGNVQAMTTLVEQIAHRQGFGDVLAEGSLRAARRIDQETERYAVQVKGQEVPPSYDPRTRFALGLGYATSPTGADHMHSIRDHKYEPGRDMREVQLLGILEPVPAKYLGPEKVRLAVYETDWAMLENCLGLCMFINYSKEQLRDTIQGITGWNSSIFELMKVGERAMAMARAFNYRQGLTAQDDVMHWRFSTPLKSGPNEGAKVPAEDMVRALDLYYEMRGWGKETGAPTAGKLHELGVGWVAELLYGD